MSKELAIYRKIGVILLLLIGIPMLLSTACESVDSGHKGVMISYGGATDMSRVYEEGLYVGPSWIMNDMIQYDVRETTTVADFEFNDLNDMATGIQVALDWRINPNTVNVFHKNIKDYQTMINKSLASAAKEVVPQYGAVELNKSKRNEGEDKLASILKDELSEFYIEFIRVRFTDINIPKGISDLAEQTAVQIGKNELAAKMELEKQNLAKAKVAEAQGNYDAEVLNDKTKSIQSKPQYLELYKAETERIWAQNKMSPYGANNVFGDGFLKIVQ